MTLSEALAELEALGTAQNRKVYQRHGVKTSLFGVSYADLAKLKKRIKVDHSLAEALWRSRNHDARVLAAKIADPKQVDAALLERWIGDLDNYVLTDAFSQLAAAAPAVRELAEHWMESPGEWVARAGWTVLALRTELFDDQLNDRLKQIERSIHSAPNRVRDAMNNALIAIGLLGEPWQQPALDVADRIGAVEVDHGETGCKTPAAAECIRKALARKRRR